MSKHYKKLILLLIPACAGFCLALALGSAEEPSELCHLCQNKALVKEAIRASNAPPYDAGLPDQFDPNYLQYGPTNSLGQHFLSYRSGIDEEGGYGYVPVTFEKIIAEGDMVAVLVTWVYYKLPPEPDVRYTKIAIYRTSGGKIIEGWVPPSMWSELSLRK